MQFSELLQFTFGAVRSFMLLLSGDGASSKRRIPLWNVRLYVMGHKRQGHSFIQAQTKSVCVFFFFHFIYLVYFLLQEHTCTQQLK